MFKWMKDQFAPKEEKTKKENEEELAKNHHEPERENAEDGQQEAMPQDMVEQEAVNEMPVSRDEKTTQEAQETKEKVETKDNWFERLKKGLQKTKNGFVDQMDRLLGNYLTIDDELYEELEEILISADVGMESTIEIIDRLQEEIKARNVKDVKEVKPLLKEIILESLSQFTDAERQVKTEAPAVVMVIGVNGVGKTTTIGKLAYQLSEDGKKVMLAAGDTFRAAAAEQLKEWANRAQVDIVAHHEGADPGAVIYDGIHAARARKADVLICDTAGRLHNKANLMKELGKIFRILEREYPEANKEVLLVLDATTGQNAVMQAKTFAEVTNITGIALTKLDGTAKGGITISLEKTLQIPVKLVGVGEGIEDLQRFRANEFVEALFS